MTKEELKEHCIRQIADFERISKIAAITPNDNMRYSEHKLVLELLEQEPRWIPCSERLPDVPKYYLIQNEYGDMFVARYASSKYWIRTYQITPIGDKVVAWMPLPEPYVEKEVD